MTQVADLSSLDMQAAFSEFLASRLTAGQSQGAPEPPKPPTPLTNPVPGAWMQAPGGSIPACYVPFEPITRREERPDGTAKEVVVGYGPGAHHKRLLAEQSWMYVNGPDGAVSGAAASDLANTEAQLRARAEQAERDREAMQQELEALRAKMAQDGGVPNASKRGSAR